LHRNALDTLDGTGNKWQQAWALGNLAGAYCAQGHISDAIDRYQQARAIFREIGDRRREAKALAELGHAQRIGGQSDAAQQSWHQALGIFEEFGHTRTDQIRAQLKGLTVQEDETK
jgi:tetratricopeptide (TPR) repeat protein